MKKTLLICVVILPIFYLGAGFYISGEILGGPNRGYDESREVETLVRAGLTEMPTREAVTIENDGINIAGSYYKNPNNGNCAIVMLHGRGGNRAETMSYFPLFWQLNCDVLAYDQRGFGDSSNTARTFGYFGRKDAAIAVSWLSEKSALPVSQIGILGTSYGSAVALQTLAERFDLAFVIADSPFSSLSAIVTEHVQRTYGGWASILLPGAFSIAELRAGFEVEAVSPENIVATSQTPVLLIHMAEDHTNELANSERIFANSNQQTTVLEVLDWGRGHANGIRKNPEAYSEIVYEFIGDLAPQYLN